MERILMRMSARGTSRHYRTAIARLLSARCAWRHNCKIVRTGSGVMCIVEPSRPLCRYKTELERPICRARRVLTLDSSRHSTAPSGPLPGQGCGPVHVMRLLLPPGRCWLWQMHPIEAISPAPLALLPHSELCHLCLSAIPAILTCPLEADATVEDEMIDARLATFSGAVSAGFHAAERKCRRWESNIGLLHAGPLGSCFCVRCRQLWLCQRQQAETLAFDSSFVASSIGTR